ncbi:MAG: L-2-hydroxyglutarate oxidase [Pirellulales bacterium]
MYDFAIIGGGIVGLATAWRLSQRHYDCSVLLLEKESTLAAHQTGRNSGVIHSGIYYKPGSLRALNCRAGKTQLEAFCREHGVAIQTTGKVIVAVDAGELPRLESLYERGRANGVTCELIGPERLRELEPHCAGIRAIHVPEAGIVDYPGVCAKLAELACAVNTRIVLNARVEAIADDATGVRLSTNVGEFAARRLVTCGGLYSDRLAQLAGESPDARIVPFRGEYYELRPAAQHLCKTLIYPVPDPRFPFLGVHFTRMIHGGVECGPNAVLALAREGYTWSDVNLAELWETLTFPGFLRLAGKYWKTGAGEVWRSLNPAAFLAALQRLIPELTAADLRPGPAGVRAQAVSPAGDIVDDFVIRHTARAVHVLNAPSPAATASLNIATSIVDALEIE